MNGGELFNLILDVTKRFAKDDLVDVGDGTKLRRTGDGSLEGIKLAPVPRTFTASSLNAFVGIVRLFADPNVCKPLVLVHAKGAHGIIRNRDEVKVRLALQHSRVFEWLKGCQEGWHGNHRILMSVLNGILRDAILPEVEVAFSAVRFVTQDATDSVQRASRSTLGRLVDTELSGKDAPIPMGFEVSVRMFELAECPHASVGIDVQADVENQEFVLRADLALLAAAEEEACEWLRYQLAGSLNDTTEAISKERIEVVCAALG